MEENKALIRRFFEEAWINRNPAAVDEFMAPDYVEHAGIPGSRSSGGDALKQLPLGSTVFTCKFAGKTQDKTGTSNAPPPLVQQLDAFTYRR